MMLDKKVRKTSDLIEARSADEPEANGGHFALNEAGREAVRQILNEPLEHCESNKP